MIVEQAGDTISWDIPLIDGLTREPVDSTTVEEAWVSVGRDHQWSLDDEELALEPTSLRLTLAPAISTAWSGLFQVWAKVRLNDGRVSTILNGEQVSLQNTPLTTAI